MEFKLTKVYWYDDNITEEKRLTCYIFTSDIIALEQSVRNREYTTIVTSFSEPFTVDENIKDLKRRIEIFKELKEENEREKDRKRDLGLN